jgi:hypothetical protein
MADPVAPEATGVAVNKEAVQTIALLARIAARPAVELAVRVDPEDPAGARQM